MSAPVHATINRAKVLLTNLALFVATDDTRPYLTYVLLSGTRDPEWPVEFVATDSYALIRWRIPKDQVESTLDPDDRVLIPGEWLPEIARYAGPHRGLEIKWLPGPEPLHPHVEVVCGERAWRRDIELEPAQFPNHSNLWPLPAPAETVGINPTLFTRLAKVVSPHSGKAYDGMRPLVFRFGGPLKPIVVEPYEPGTGIEIMLMPVQLR